MRSLLQDIRYGWRLMRKSPGFTIAAVVTLALGIGANSAIFGVINWLSLTPLPYHEPSRLAFFLGWDVEEDEMRFSLRLADYLDLRREARSVESIAAYSYVSANLTGGDLPERVQAYRVTPNTFTMLGVAAAIGRTFDEFTENGRDDVAVISHGLWQRRFAGDSAIIGRTVVLNGRTIEVIGVMPPRFEYPVFNFKGDIWTPWIVRDAGRGEPSATQVATIVGRIRQRTALTTVQSELATLMAAYASAHPQTNRGIGIRVIEMGKLDEDTLGPTLPILFTTVALVLILACANVANLLLARGVSRQRELAVRAAIGASRFRIARQLLIESLLLALAGGAAGLLVAMVALQAFRSVLPEMVLTTLPNSDDIGVDRTALLFTLAISVLTSIVFGVVPAWRATHDQFQDGLKESASSGGGRTTRRLRTGLVITEVALSTLLLVGAGLLVRSYASLRHIDPGFEANGVLTMALTLPDYKYPDVGARARFYEQAIARIEAIPGVRSAGFVNTLPFSSYDRATRLTIDGVALPDPGREPFIAYRVASARYFEAMRIDLLDGRPFDRRDAAMAPPVAIVNRTLASRYLGSQSPIGRRVRFGRSDDVPWVTIVGVVDDVRHSELTGRSSPEIYLPSAQMASAMMMLAVRTDARPEDLVSAVRAEIHAVDPVQPVYHVKTLEQLIADSILPRTTSAGLMTIFSVLALVLAAVGVYGVVAYGVRQQTREFGVRIALGATPKDLLSLVLRHALLMVGSGVAIGALAAFGLARLMGTVLYGVGPADPLTYAGVIVLLGATGLVACSVPAWRAATTLPATALRMD